MENQVMLPEVQNPANLMRYATDVAGVSKEIVMKTAISIQGRKYVRVEGWQAIAMAHGTLLSARDVERIDGGIRAIGEVRRMSDGMVLATAEGFVGDDEKTWGKRDEFAKRAMAQTRAMSRVARSAFAHVVVMIDKSLSTTPAEEMYDVPEETPKRKGDIDQFIKAVEGARTPEQLNKFALLATERTWTPDEETRIADVLKIRKEEMAS